MRLAHRKLALHRDARSRYPLGEWQLGEPTLQDRRVPRHVRRDAGNKRSNWFEAEWWAIESRPLLLRDRSEGKLSVLERKLGRQSKDRRGCGGEEWILLVAHTHLARSRKECVRTTEDDRAQIVIDLVVDIALEQSAFDRYIFRMGAYLQRLELNRARVAAALRLITRDHPIDRLRSLRRVQILVGISIERVVGRVCEWLRESCPRERLHRRIKDEIVAEQLLLSATGGQKVWIVGARPDAILDVEGA